MPKDHRRKFLLASSALLAAPFTSLTSFAQPAQKLRRIGFLTHVAAESAHGKGVRQMMVEVMRRVGYEEGRNLIIEWRFAEDRVERLPGLAEGLIKLNVEVIVAYRNEAIIASKRATQTIPIVMAVSILPVENGFVASLAHPGGNITGTTWVAGQEDGKLYQILRDALPKARRVTLLLDPAEDNARNREEISRIAAATGWTLTRVEITRPDDLKATLDRIVVSRADALVIEGHRVIQSRIGEIAAFAVQRKLASITLSTTNLAAGALLYYGPNVVALWMQTSIYVDQILRGKKPSDMPVQQPSKFELVLNAKTARAIGFKASSSFMVLVNRQVE